MTRILMRGGRVVTPDPRDRHTAVLVSRQTVEWIGDDADAPVSERVVELDGRLVTPAFVDAHVHLALTGFSAMGVDLRDTRSAAEALDLLAVHARSTGLGILLGHGWDETHWAGGVPFTRRELDSVVGGRPAYVARVDLHSAVASTALLEAGRAHLDTPIEELVGWSDQGPLTREAHHAVRDAMRALLSADDRASAIRLALQVAAARGIGMVHELGAPHISDPGDFALTEQVRAEAARNGRVLPEVVGYWGELGVAALSTVWSLGCVGAAGDICMDGAIGSRTAALAAPYTDAPGTSGHLYVTADRVTEHVVACTEAGLQAGFHVIGDRAAAEVVSGFAAAAERLGTEAVRAARHRLEHLEMVDAGLRRTLAELGVTASMQPLFQAWWGGPGGLYETRLGDRSASMNAFAALAEVGVPLAFGSDSPVTPFDPWAAVRAAACHHDSAQRLDAVAAFEAHTVGGWRAARRDEGGTLEPGAPAYLAVWDATDDLLTTLGNRNQPLPTCALTMVAGEVAYDGGGLMS